MHGRARQGTVALLGLALAACSFRVSGFDLAGFDLAGFDLGDAATSPLDLAGTCSGAAPVGCSADGESLLVCVNGEVASQACAEGCSTTGAAHCKGVDPSGVAAPADYQASGLQPVTISGAASIDTGSGAIDAGPLQRAAGPGVDPATGIGFRVATQSGAPGVGIFSFVSFTLASGAVLTITGPNALALVAASSVDLEGEVDGQGTCAPGTAVGGGGAGGAAGAAGSGQGGGGAGVVSGTQQGGGGGGGFGGKGGAGAAPVVNSGGAGGAAYGNLASTDATMILVGGSGGGGGGGAGAGSGAGGSGGGAVQIVANGTVTLGGAAIIQVGGCHGSAGVMNQGGGGGGAGGAILIEGVSVSLVSGAILAANGGGGGGGGGNGSGTPTDGDDATPDDNKASGGSGGHQASDGGSGGYHGTIGGATGQSPQATNLSGGGGGGATGRIALKSASGTVDTSNATLSPELGKGSPPPVTVGSALVD